MTIQASRFARVCLEESFKYALKRKTFGKTLMEHPVIRAKIGEMARQVECTHAQLENITYQMCTLSKKDAMEKVRHHSHGIPVLRTHSSLVESQLGGPTALLKAQSTKVFEFCAREAAQIFGGASYVRGGQGEKVRVACIACQAMLKNALASAGGAPVPRGPRVCNPRRIGGDHDRSRCASGDEGRKARQAVSALHSGS